MVHGSSMLRLVHLCTLVIVAAALLGGLPGEATEAAKVVPEMIWPTEILYPTAFGVTPPLPQIKARVPVPGEPAQVPNDVHPGEWVRKEAGVWNDPVVQSTPALESMPQPLATFAGLNNLDNVAVIGYPVAPPDTNGDIGPNHYVQWVNWVLEVFDRNGSSLWGPGAGSVLFAGLPVGSVCRDNNSGDPIVLYDSMADRWLASQFALPGGTAGPFYQCVAVSTSGDPLGSWYAWEFHYSDTVVNDYPKWGVWPDAFLMTANQFQGATLAGVGALAFDRSRMLAGHSNPPAVRFDLPQEWSMLPADLDGPTPPAAGSPGLFAMMEATELGDPADAIELWQLSFVPSRPWMSLMSQLATLPTAPFDPDLCGATRERCIHQPGTSMQLEAISDRLMHRAAYRNFGTHEALYLNHTVDADGAGRAGIRWYELRSSGSGWVIHQQGTFSPDSDHRFMGSIAADGEGNIAVGYSVSSSSTYPSIRYAGRRSSDPLGQLTLGEAEIVAGGGSQTHSWRRWGDYSMMSVDPVDDETFWYTQEYMPATSSLDWYTQIGSFRVQPSDMTVELPFSAPEPLLNHATGALATIVNPPVYWMPMCEVAGTGAYKFVGNSARIEVFDGLDQPEQITLESWVRVDGPIPQGGTRMVTMVRKVGSYSLFVQPWGGHHFVFWVDAEYGGAKQTSSPDTLAFGTWYHVVGTYDGSQQRIYVNGIPKDTSFTLTGPVVGSAGTARIGEGFPVSLNGVIGNVNIYSRALSEAEVLALYQSYTIDDTYCYLKSEEQ